MDQRALVLFCFVLDCFRVQAEEDEEAESWEQRFRYVLPLVAAFYLFKLERIQWLGCASFLRATLWRG